MFRKRPVLAGLSVIVFVLLFVMARTYPVLLAGAAHADGAVLRGDVSVQAVRPFSPFDPPEPPAHPSAAAAVTEPQEAGRVVSAEPLSAEPPRPCKRTRGGAVFQADDRGRVCLLEHVDPSPATLGCCIDGRAVAVDCPAGPTRCFEEPSFCVACCARSGADFSACRRDCRTSSASVKDQRVFKSTKRFCF